MTMYAQAGAIALKILAGTPAAEIPVERPTLFTLSFNLKTAKASASRSRRGSCCGRIR
jgi:ABC-type uncharacterized transport system substrate-binding protein